MCSVCVLVIFTTSIYPWTPRSLPTTLNLRMKYWTSISLSVWTPLTWIMAASDGRCCVPRCGKTRNDNTVLHRFPDPNKDKERYLAWIQAIGSSVSSLDPQYIYKNRKVCHAHFEIKHLTWSSRLSHGAVPTLLMPEHDIILPQQPEHLQSPPRATSPVPSTSRAEATQPTASSQLSAPDGGTAAHPQQQSTLADSDMKYYSSTDMEGTMEAVLNANFLITEAAKMYNVPRQTLTAKLRSLRRDSVQSAVKQEVQDKQYFFVEEVKKILSFTTAVPFKTKVSRYYCAFCNKNIDSFDHPSELRTHTSLHEDEMVYEMDRILRPQYRNEILKVDIRDFQCKDCAEPIQSWNDMFIHLSEVHEIELDEVHNRLIPYNLTSNSLVNCALCGAEFPHFKYLDAHMNTHYCNYTCSECGETFLTEIRLKRHKVIHNTSKYPCKHCGKVFSFEKYKKNHEAMVHHGEYKMFRCIDCGEQFLKQYERHLHIVEQHPFRVRISTCEVCGKNFDWRPYYLVHLRKAHTICRYCGKRFETKYEVKTHEMRHTGDGRFVCMFCEKNFVTSIELTRHYDERHF